MALVNGTRNLCGKLCHGRIRLLGRNRRGAPLVRPMELLRFKRLSAVMHPIDPVKQVGATNKQHLDCNPGCGLLPPPILH